MKEILIKLYDYSELSEKAKEKAREWYNDGNDMPFLEEDLKEFLKDCLKENKIKIELEDDFKIYYSLGYSQGDGFCFVGRFKWKNYRVYIKHIGHYYHKRSVNIIIETINYNEAKQEVQEDFKNLYESICNKLEKTGYDIIEDEQSEERISETMEMNNYQFLENGERMRI